MRILLISPTALDQAGRPVKQRRIHLPGLTLAMLAAVTPPEAELHLVHETAEEVPFDQPWDLVGLTGMGSGIVRAWQIADEFRRRGRKVVIGGIAASLARPEWTLAHADALVVGEAEELWPQVVADARRGVLQPLYRMAQPPDVATLPVPRYEVLTGRRFGRWSPVQATRGCPFPCTFCSVTAFFGQGYRKRPVGQVVRDVRAAKRIRGSRYVAFIDDNIGVDWDYCRDLWQALVPENIVWISQCSLHIADRPEMLALARRSGCRLLSFGIESTDPASLETVRKGWNRPERYAEAIRAVRDHGIDVSTEMILGLDADDESVFARTHEFIMANRISVPRIHILTPVPGTPLFEKLSAEGNIVSQDFSRYSGGQVVFRPRRLDPAALQAGYWKLYEGLFSWRAIGHRLARNRASLGAYMRAFILAVNLHYRNHIGRRICPGIV
ncbi:MAG: B12-binding domain-containing radical SAM protein [Planctomycetes bacterium]|nr:B12-binding domain-containing radical SAM protein [Planctomycetota bacterium]